MQTTPLRVKRPHTKAIRLMLVSRSSRLKPRPLLKCVRTISPSSTSTLRPHCFKRCSIISDRVLLPEPERPVNQMVKPVDAIYEFLSFCAALKRFPLHIGRDWNPQLFQNGRGHVHQLQAAQLATAGTLVGVGVVFDDNAELGMVAIVWAGIVVKGVDGTVTNGANRTPEEVAEVDDQVGRNTVDVLINFLWFEDCRPHWLAIVVEQILELRFEFVAQSFNFVGPDDA